MNPALTCHIVCMVRQWSLSFSTGSRLSTDADSTVGNLSGGPTEKDCAKDIERPCKPPWKVKLVTIIWGGLSACYVILYLAYNLTANHRLAKLPYSRYRTGHALFAWQVQSPPLHFCRLPCFWLGQWILLLSGQGSRMHTNPHN